MSRRSKVSLESLFLRGLAIKAPIPNSACEKSRQITANDTQKFVCALNRSYHPYRGVNKSLHAFNGGNSRQVDLLSYWQRKADTNLDVHPKFLLVMCICACDIVIYCYICIFQSTVKHKSLALCEVLDVLRHLSSDPTNSANNQR